MCCKVETDLLRLLGKTDAISVQARAKLLKGMQEHEKIHLAARQELDDAGLQAVCNPRMMWTIIVDAATQRNFNLPKFKGRMPKAFTKLPFWEFKLMCVYAYGYGFCPYLVHKSQSAGANLTWTVIWEVLCDMRAYHGFYAEVLHIQLDNTKSDNKLGAVLGCLGPRAWLRLGWCERRSRALEINSTHACNGDWIAST